MAKRPAVFLSSTFSDLSDHRRAVIEVCRAIGVAPLGLETEAAAEPPKSEAIARAMADADLFIGIIGPRYGAVAEGSTNAFAAMEYAQARSQGLPTLMFLQAADQPFASDGRTGTGDAERASAIQDVISGSTLVEEFSSVAELEAEVATALRKAIDPQRRAHPMVRVNRAYVGSGPFINRTTELAALRAWQDSGPAPLMVLRGIGGVGKTALAWAFFDAAAASANFEAQFWWSFYENADFDEFLAALLRFLRPDDPDGPVDFPSSALVEHALSELHRRQTIVVLDGLERLILSQAAQQMPLTSTNPVYRTRRLQSPHAVRFLLETGSLERSKILTTTRLLPLDLETPSGLPMPHVQTLDVAPLSLTETTELLSELTGETARETLKNLATLSGGHPLVATELAQLLTRHANLTPDDLISYVGRMQSAGVEPVLRRLARDSATLLRLLSEDEAPMTYETLVGKVAEKHLRLALPSRLDRALTDLEDAGLLNWDRESNAYSLHPLTRLGIAKWFETLDAEAGNLGAPIS